MPSRRSDASHALLHVLGPAVDAARVRILGVAHDAELGREHDLVAPVGDRLARPAARW